MLVEHRTDSLNSRCAGAIRDAFDAYQREFKAVTGRARSRFERQEWRGMQQDARERLDLYPRAVTRIVADVYQILGDGTHDRAMWAQMKAVYTRSIADRGDLELAETFFNSVTRRIFATVGVDPKIEYVASDFDAPARAGEPVYRRYEGRQPIAARVRDILADYQFAVPYGDIDLDARLVADRIEAQGEAVWGGAIHRGDRGAQADLLPE